MSFLNHPISRKTIIQYAKENSITIDEEAVIKPGDLYLAGRNTNIELLTCKRVGLNGSCIFPEENAYPYDTHECIKVVC